jgi:hypothetical protein
MLYGGNLDGVHSVSIARLPDGPPGEPSTSGSFVNAARAFNVPALQPSAASLKFILPQSLRPGIFAINYGGNPVLMGTPQIDWCQPTQLLPGLEENEATPGSTIQIIGRNFLLTPGSANRVRAALRSNDGRIVLLTVSHVDKYSITARLPISVAPGRYEIWVHNGYAASKGWGGGLSLNIRAAARWPANVFDVRRFGARGDNVTDDSDAFKDTLNAAERNGGGIVYFPAGTYRVNGWFFIPQHVVVRGRNRGLTFLKWPETLAASSAGFIPAVLYSSGEFGIENLTLLAVNAQTLLRDLSWDADQSGRAPVSKLQPHLAKPWSEHDVFLRDVDFQLLYYAPRSADPARDPRWLLNGFGWKNGVVVTVIAFDGVRNLEISNCRFVGGAQRVLDVVNARIINNRFDNQWATLSWTDPGGQYVIFQNNLINGASGWSSGQLAVRHIYCAYNRSNNLVSGEREALTLDINKILGRRISIEWNGLRLPAVQPWQGYVVSTDGTTVRLANAHLLPHSYHGLDLLILRGTGVGQYRQISDNTEDSVTLSAPWSIEPDHTSLVLAFQLPGHCIFFQNQAEDTSVLSSIWGYLYDCTFDENRAVRSQGMWGLSGWFVQWLDNDLSVASTYHRGVGPAGYGGEATPEGGAPYGFLGFAVAGRFASEPISFPYVRACLIRKNHLSFGHRILITFGFGGARKKAPDVVAQDVIIDRNIIDHTEIGVEVDANIVGALIKNNSFTEVVQPLSLADPQAALVLQ